jgi:hypothetical protein
MSQPCSDHKRNEEVTYHYKKAGEEIRHVRAVVIKAKKKYVRIRALIDGRSWDFRDVLPIEIERVVMK